MCAQYRQVRRLVTGDFIDRREALAHVVDLSADVQARIIWERELPGLPLADQTLLRRRLKSRPTLCGIPVKFWYDEDRKSEQGNYEKNSCEEDM